MAKGHARSAITGRYISAVKEGNGNDQVIDVGADSKLDLLRSWPKLLGGAKGAWAILAVSLKFFAVAPS